MARILFKLTWFSSLVILLLTGCSTDESDKEEVSHRNDLVLGASARDFLSDEKFTALEIEIVYVTGFEPTPSALNNLKIFLNKYINKPDGITIKTRAVASPNLGTYSREEYLALEKTHRTSFSSGKTLSTFIFFADEKSVDSEENKKIIGKAYMNTSMIIFDKEVLEMSGSSLSRSEIQTTALHHEFGHLFGLVNNGSPAQTPHEETESSKKAHCVVDGCLMAASIAFGSSPFSYLEDGENIVDFDEKCQLDLKANGGK
ncbi:hypothetical protein HC174_11505 [Salinimicrobium sp. CDJ15-81-2]|nr:hypothetical protein [Salinimicrobium nanhaiense]